MIQEVMSSNERMKKLIAREKIDRVPVNPLVSLYAAYITNMNAKEYFLEPEKAMEAQLLARELHGYDAGPSYNIPDGNGWDFGGLIEIPDSPRITLPKLTKRAIKSSNEVEKLKVPNPMTAPAMSRYLRFGELSVEKGFSSVTVGAGSPMGIAESIVGAELLLRWIRKEPSLVHRLLRIATDYILEVGQIYVNKFGSENCSAFSTYPMECHELMSPKMFEEYSLPYVKEIHEKFINMGIKKWTIHLCGDHTKNLIHWQENIKLVPRTIFTPGHEMDILKTGKALGEDYVIGGNVHTTLMQIGSARDVYKASKEIIEKMKYHPGGFILTPDCVLPSHTPPANVHAMIKACKDFGRYN
ncbi:putative Methyltransferase [Acetoanaerobium sticklandii]|uniref:Putative Methyltransferase n=1 Tax=Acetoanaerobium sticklandii (strain ATCC 12662 / DSM 519 / JCM 1433 / CCUG 9281 / NCIMB 10654 / HF) TaxID=499177 RepID=E3PR07_ACESD|nr:uroporphyrinogen decarboxylase family protein [Acetoanaerobium sticklandii]CBH20222.1 putative Methyltransferase [Acetoanaerobium sticklandii]